MEICKCKKLIKQKDGLLYYSTLAKGIDLIYSDIWRSWRIECGEYTIDNVICCPCCGEPLEHPEQVPENEQNLINNKILNALKTSASYLISLTAQDPEFIQNIKNIIHLNTATTKSWSPPLCAENQGPFK